MTQDMEAVSGNVAEIDVCGDGSIMKEILVEGTGDETPAKGVKTKVHYVGTLMDGTKFDSSRDRGDPFEFTIGQGVITGWSEGVATMKIGEKSMFTIASNKAYGESGSPPKIPGGATLKFEIELLSFTSYEDISGKTDEGVMKKTVKAGERWETPDDLSETTFHMTIKVANDTVYTSRDGAELAAIMGDEDVVEGIELGIRKMKKGEEAILRIQPEYGFGAQGSDTFHVPANTAFDAHVELLDFKNPVQYYEPKDAKESLVHVRALKEAGNAKFKAQRFAAAVKRYSTAIQFVEEIDDEDSNEEQKKEIAGLIVSLSLNHAAALIKTGKFTDAREACDKVTKSDPKNVKAAFRRAQSWLEEKDYTEATAAFKACLALDETNTTAKAALQKALKGKKIQEAQEKKLYGKMFG